MPEWRVRRSRGRWWFPRHGRQLARFLGVSGVTWCDLRKCSNGRFLQRTSSAGTCTGSEQTGTSSQHCVFSCFLLRHDISFFPNLLWWSGADNTFLHFSRPFSTGGTQGQVFRSLRCCPFPQRQGHERMEPKGTQLSMRREQGSEHVDVHVERVCADFSTVRETVVFRRPEAILI